MAWSMGVGCLGPAPKAYKDWAVPEANKEDMALGAGGQPTNWLPLPGGLPTAPQKHGNFVTNKGYPNARNKIQVCSEAPGSLSAHHSPAVRERLAPSKQGRARASLGRWRTAPKGTLSWVFRYRDNTDPNRRQNKREINVKGAHRWLHGPLL